MSSLSLQEFLHQRGYTSFEGFSSQVPEQVEDLIRLTSQPNLRVMEIGFNAGHSANNFLENNPSLSLVSFDLGYHSYVAVGKEYIDCKFPGRHELILGDSTVSVPEFINQRPHEKFDVIFVDGGHSYEVAKQDMENCRKLAHESTIVILDDTYFSDLTDMPRWASYVIGPTRVWNEFVQDHKLAELGKRDYLPYRGMAWGKYLF